MKQLNKEHVDVLRLGLKGGRSFIYHMDFDEDRKPVIRFTMGQSSVLGFADHENHKQVPRTWVEERLHPDDLPVLRGFEEFLKSGAKNETVLEYRFKNQNGTYRWLRDCLSLIYSDDGHTLKGYVGFVSDITEKKIAEKIHRLTQERLLTALEISGAFSYVRELTTGEIVFHNGLKRLIGSEESEKIDRTWWMRRIHPDDIECCEKVICSATQKGEDFKLEYRVLHQSGHFIHVQEFARAILDPHGKPVQHAGFVMDISELKRGHEQLKKRDAEKNEFLAMLGHELRNPLASLLTAVDILDSSSVLENGELESLKKVFKRQVHHMQVLLDDLLMASRLKRGKVQLKYAPVNLADVLKSLIADKQGKTKNKSIIINLFFDESRSYYISGDEVRLTQIFDNLLSNALKFTSSGDRIDICLQYDDANNTIDVRIQDTGAGMSADLLRNIFEPFRQGEQNLARELGGLGLGLAVAKGFVELHCGNISAESQGIGHGSTFTVCLPALKRIQIERQGTAKKETAYKKNRILIVEDNHDFGELLKTLLEKKKLCVRWEQDGKAALRAAKEFQPELILCDIGLPNGYTGYDLVTELRQNPQFKNTPIIAITGYGQKEDELRAQETGFQRHLRKPVRNHQIDDLITEYLGQR